MDVSIPIALVLAAGFIALNEYGRGREERERANCPGCRAEDRLCRKHRNEGDTHNEH